MTHADKTTFLAQLPIYIVLTTGVTGPLQGTQMTDADKTTFLVQLPICIVLTTGVTGPLQGTQMTDADKTTFLAQLPIGIVLIILSANRTETESATTSASGLFQRAQMIDADRNPVLSHVLPSDANWRLGDVGTITKAQKQPPVEFPTDLPVRPSCRRPRVPQTSTIAPGHRPVYLAIFDNPEGESGPNHWGLYVPYVNDESGTMISANRVSEQWKIQFSRNYAPGMSRFLVWFFYLGQVPKGSFTDYSHLPGRQYSSNPDGELEEVTKAIPLPRSELRVSFGQDNNFTPGRFD